MDDKPNASHTTTTFGYGPPTQKGKVPFTPPGTQRACETAYRLWGDVKSDKPVLIILHGGPGAPGRDLQTLAVLHDRHAIPVLIYDQIGCGESTHLRDLRGDSSFWTEELFVAELDNLRKQLGIASFDLLGHSWGGRYVVLYALTQPAGLRKLIFASTACSDKLWLESFRKRRATLPQHLQDAIALRDKSGGQTTPDAEAADKTLDRIYFCRLDTEPAELKETIALISEDDTVPFSINGTKFMEGVPRKEFDPIPRLREITKTTAPGGVLLTNGRWDMVPDEAMTPLFTDIAAPVKWIRFAESAHFPHLEENEAYMVAVGDFLTT